MADAVIRLSRVSIQKYSAAFARPGQWISEKGPVGAISMIQFEFGPANIYSRTYFYNPITYYGEHLEVFLTTNYFAARKQTS